MSIWGLEREWVVFIVVEMLGNKKFGDGFYEGGVSRSFILES